VVRVGEYIPYCVTYESVIGFQSPLVCEWQNNLTLSIAHSLIVRVRDLRSEEFGFGSPHLFAFKIVALVVGFYRQQFLLQFFASLFKS
jgi:hypothetical protein